MFELNLSDISDSKLRDNLMIQKDRWEALERNGTGPWMTVYSNEEHGYSHYTIFAVFAPCILKDRLLKKSSWDIGYDNNLPKFMEHNVDGKWERRYHPFGNHLGIEPIVIFPYHHEIKPEMTPRLLDEFIRYHNLWIGEDGLEYYKIFDDGTDELAVKIFESKIEVRSNLIRQFQAGRQVHLIKYISSAVTDTDICGWGFEPMGDFSKEVTLDKECMSLSVSKNEAGRYRSRIYGKKILEPLPLSKAGIWPWSEDDKGNRSYLDFIIGEDNNGDEVLHTSNCDGLETSRYLTPVFFSPNVLSKYYDDDRYEVGDGYLRCGSLWGIHIDNNNPDYVMVFLGDLGRLPIKEEQYWRSCNIVPPGPPSDTALRRSILAEFADPQSPDLIFRMVYTKIKINWTVTKGWSLFKDSPSLSDSHILNSVRVPPSNSIDQFDRQILSLTKLLVECLDDRNLTNNISSPIPKNTKSISKLQLWLEQENYPNTERDIRFLRGLNDLRNQSAAHLKTSNYSTLLGSLNVSSDKRDGIKHLLTSAVRFLRDIAAYNNVPLDVYLSRSKDDP